MFRIHVLDKDGRAITGAKTTVDFLRSSDMRVDQHHVLEEVEPGFYGHKVNLPLAGCWQLKIMITRGDDIHEVRGDSEVSELIDGKLVRRECVDGEPLMDTDR